MNTETFTRCYKFALSRSPDNPPPIPWPGWVPFSSLPMIWEGKLIAGGADMQAGPANLPQRDPHLSATPNLKNPTSPQLTSAGCRPRSSRLILLSIVPCVGRRKKGPNWKKWWASEFGRGTLGSELQGRPGRLPADRSVMARSASSLASTSSFSSSTSSSSQKPWWQAASPEVGRAAKFELLRDRNTLYLPSTFASLINPTITTMLTRYRWNPQKPWKSKCIYLL